MKIWISFLATYLVPLCCGLENFHDCSTYSDKEDIPKQNAYCLKDIDGLYYCKTWQCDSPNCPADQQVAQKGDSCPICPVFQQSGGIPMDTCTNGGKIFQVDDSWDCIDGSNTCRCIATGQVISTRKGTNKYWLCGAPE